MDSNCVELRDNYSLGFEYYIRVLQCERNNINELKALIEYKSSDMIVLNKARAISSVDSIIKSMLELKKAIEKCK